MATRSGKTKAPLKNIDQLPSGRWRARWTDERGERRTSTFSTRSDADLALKRAEVEVEERKRGLAGLRPVDVRLSDVWTLWQREVGYRKRSRVTDFSFWTNHLGPAFGDRGVQEIDTSLVASFVRLQEAKQPALLPTTIRHHLTLLVTLLRFAADKGYLLRAPRISKPKVDLADEDFSYLRNDEEIARFLGAAAELGELISMLYLVPIFSGLRLGEVCGLRSSDVDLPKRLITVRRSYGGPTKSGRVRQVPILDPLLSPLRAWMADARPGLMFTGSAGQMLRRDASFFKRERYLGAILERAGMPRDYISYHGTRHTFASSWMRAEGSVYKLQKILGHQSIETTQRYAHLAPDAFASDYDRISGVGALAEVAP